MYSSSASGARPTSPVEEDLQNLYNEVWAVFAEETPQQSSERDLETIYNGYTDDSDPPPVMNTNNKLSQPPSQSSRSVTPSRYPIQTNNPPASPTKISPTRRRLPPTPAEAAPASFAMPEPEPFYSPSTSQQNTGPAYSYVAPHEGIRRNDTFESTSSSSSGGRRLPQEPGQASGSRPSYGEKRMRESDYLSHHNSTNSQTSYSSSGSLASYSTKATSVTGDGYGRPPGASAPALPPKPSAYRDEPPETRYHYPSAYNNYDQGNSLDGYPHQESAASTHTQAPPKPPPPPPKPSNYMGDFSLEPIQLAPFSDFDLNNKNGSPARNSFNSQDSYQQPSAAINPYINPVAGSSNIPAIAEPRVDDWDPTTIYADGRASTYIQDDDTETAGPSDMTRRPSDLLHSLATYDHEPLDLKEPSQDDDGYWEDEDEDDETRFVNFSLLSHIAMQLRDKVPRGTHVKGSIPYPRAFTGKDIVSTIQTQIQRELAINHGVSTNDRRVALQVARSLQNQLFFYEVEWGSRALQDGVEDVYMFLDDAEGAGSDGMNEREELPTGVITMLTRCYSPSCGEGVPCYSYTCPRKGNSLLGPLPVVTETPSGPKEEEWPRLVDPVVLQSLPQAEINRQSIIHKLITREEQYLQDLDLVESVFIKPLRAADPPIMPPNQVEDLIDDIFGNILDLRETNRRLLEVLYVRQREEGPIIQRIGDIFLQAAAEFRYAYPTYIGHYPVSEKRLKEELESNNAFRLFLEQCSRQQTSRSGDSPRLDLKHFLNRPSEHLQKYPVLLEAVHNETADESSDNEFLVEAIDAIRKLQSAAQLRTFQAAMGKGTPGKWEWHDLVPAEIREKYTKKEQKRQQVIFELIKGEMAYVKDLENIKYIYIMPLRKAEPPIIARSRLEDFIDEVFHNYMDLFEHHKRLVDKLHEIQRDQHPMINSVTAALYDAALNWREAYMEYIPNYPIAAYRIDDEMANNLAFKTFVDQCVRHPDAHRLDMKNFVNRPIPRLLRYELLLKGIMEESPAGHEDIDTIPSVIEIVKSLGKETEPGVTSAKTKVELWRYNSNLTFKQGEAVDMDLLDKNRQLIHSGKLLRQPEGGLEWNGWSELQVLLFDNYFVMTKPKDKDNVTKYQVNRRPVPLDLLSLVNFTDPPTQRGIGLLKPFGGQTPAISPDNATDSRYVYPLTLHHNGRTGGPYILYAESAQIRSEWKAKLEEALGLRKVVQESNKVFEIEYLSRDTFIMPSLAVGTNGPTWNQDNQFTGKVTCSVPFNTPDGRALVAIGCSEGVWIGFRHDPKSMRRVLLLKMVTQCAMLEEFGIFLVLADKALFAYHIEALVPTPTQAAHASQAMPQKISGTKDVHFFSVGKLQGRTLVVYMKKKAMDSIFRVLEPVGDKINERVKSAAGFGSRLGFRSAKSEWFRVYRDFFLPSDSFDVIFLKARIAILCAKGFEIMNLVDFGSITLPQKEDPKHAQTLKRCENARPIGMFRSTEEEFLLCYDEFGLYVDKHGDPSRSANTIEWEGTAERAAFHSPYVLLFDPRFIEIRHIETGRLAQIISGTDIRCTWDGRGGIPHPNTPLDPADEAQEAQVHFVMNSTDPVAGTRSKNIVQHVCELIPTVPLFPVETPVSTTTTHFPLRQANPAAYQDGYSPSPTPTHQYSNSYASSVQSYTSSTAPTVQSYSASPVTAHQNYTQSLAQSQLTQQGYTPSLTPSQQSYASSTPQQVYDPRVAQQQGYALQQPPYSASQPSGQHPYAHAPGYPTQPTMLHSQSHGLPPGHVAQHPRGGYTSNLAPAPQHDLRHSHSWRS